MGARSRRVAREAVLPAWPRNSPAVERPNAFRGRETKPCVNPTQFSRPRFDPCAAGGGTRVALAYVISPPAGFVSADLADAALECIALARALRLAEWVGPGRQLTSSGVLRPAAAAEACQVLGIELPGGRLRSALDVDELMRDWTVALDADLIAFNGRTSGPRRSGGAAPRHHRERCR